MCTKNFNLKESLSYNISDWVEQTVIFIRLDKSMGSKLVLIEM